MVGPSLLAVRLERKHNMQNTLTKADINESVHYQLGFQKNDSVEPARI